MVSALQLTDKHRRDQVRLAITADSQARRLWDSTLDLNDLTGTQPVWKNHGRPAHPLVSAQRPHGRPLPAAIP